MVSKTTNVMSLLMKKLWKYTKSYPKNSKLKFMQIKRNLYHSIKTLIKNIFLFNFAHELLMIFEKLYCSSSPYYGLSLLRHCRYWFQQTFLLYKSFASSETKATNISHVMSDLNTKLKDLENKKASLRYKDYTIRRISRI